MVFIDNLRSPFDAQLRSGARWVIDSLQDAAASRGLLLSDYAWSTDDDADGEDRCVLSFRAAGTPCWEPFDPADLEDLTISESVRAHMATQLRRLVDRIEEMALRVKTALSVPPCADAPQA